MKITSLFLILLVCSCFCTAQTANKKRCDPPAVVFKNFYKNNLNILAGFTITRISNESKNYWGYGTSVAVNYFPADYFEIGYTFSPFYIKYQLLERKLLAEHSLFIKYYYLRIPCRKALVSASAGLLKDGSQYNVKGETIDANKTFVYISPVDLTLLLGKWGQITLDMNIFLNDRPLKYDFSLLFNIANFKLKKG